MACVVKRRPAELSSCRIAISENLPTAERKEGARDGRRRGREAQ